ncbi:MAG: hypothetical protein V3S69_08005 [Dehalococcoidales bacterium]
MKTKIQDLYTELTVDQEIGDKVNDMLSEAVTAVLQVPGVKEAVAIHVLNSDIRLDEMGIHDVPFQYLWERLFDDEPGV